METFVGIAIFIAALGLSVTVNVFDSDRERLAQIVMDVARKVNTGEHGESVANGDQRRLASVS